MISIPEAVEEIVRRSPSLADGMSRGVLNLSALARVIRPEVERSAMKPVSDGAVIMALNRLARRVSGRESERDAIFQSAPDLMVRSNLMEITFANSGNLTSLQMELMDRVGVRREPFLTVTRGIFETTIIAARELEPVIDEVFRDERALAKIEGLTSLTVQLPPGTARVPGVYGFLLQSLAWEGINVVEVVSTLNELTIILPDDGIDRAFSVIKALFRNP